MSIHDLVRARESGETRNAPVPRPRFRWETRLLLPLALLSGAAALLIGTAWTTLFPGRPVDVMPVMVKAVEAGAGQVTVTASGWLEPDPYPIFVAALANGIVAEVPVLEGQAVAAGDVVARLIREDAELTLARAEAELAIRQAEILEAEAELEASRSILETLVDRQGRVDTAAGQVAELEASLARLGPRVAAEEARLAGIDDEIQRKQKLVESGAVSEGELRRLVLSREAIAATRDAVEAERSVLHGQLQQARSALRTARRHTELLIEERRDVRTSEAALARAEGAARQAVAVRDEARLRLSRMTVTAPVAGIVLQRLVSPGSRVVVGGDEHGAHIVHLYDPKRLQARVDVPLVDAAAVGVDQAAEVVVQALPDRVFRGKVTRLVHRADIQKNTVEVKVALEDPEPVLKPEMLARIRFLAGPTRVESRQRLLVPEAVLLRDGGEARVWVVVDRLAERGHAELRQLELGSATLPDPETGETWREIASGLQPGDWIILRPPGDLETGDRVTIRSGGTP